MGRLPEIGEKIEVMVDYGKKGLPVIFKKEGLVCLPRGIPKSLLREARELLPEEEDQSNSWRGVAWFLRVSVVAHAKSGKAIFVFSPSFSESLQKRKDYVERRREEEKEEKRKEEKRRREEEKEEKKMRREEEKKEREVVRKISSVYNTRDEIPSIVKFTRRGKTDLHPFFLAMAAMENDQKEEDEEDDLYAWFPFPRYGLPPQKVEEEVRGRIQELAPEFATLSEGVRHAIIELVMSCNYQKVIWRNLIKKSVTEITLVEKE